MPPIVIELFIALVLIVAMLVAFFIGRRIGRVSAEEQPHMGVVQGACLGVFGLLLSFSFAGAMSRFVERQDMIVKESNAAGTLWLRSDLLEPADRAALRELLRQYMQERIELSATDTETQFHEVNGRLDELQGKIWACALDAVVRRPNTSLLILPPTNDLFDLLSTRNAAEHRHMPAAIAVLEIIGAILCMLIIGFAQYRPSRVSTFPGLTLLVLIGVVIWVTIDLDFPRHGVIQVNPAPLHHTLQSMTPPK
jgi:hypothetical protein